MTSPEPSSKPNRIIGSIRSQLVFGFGLILVLALVIALIGYQSLQSLQKSVQTTLDESNRIRQLSLEIKTEFLQARQAESNFLASWRSLGFETAQDKYGSTNELHLEQARSKLNEIDSLVQNSGDPELKLILEDTASLVPLLHTYESAFQAVVTDIEERSRPDGQENTLNTTLNELEAIVSPLPNPEFHQLVLKIRANEQSYLNTGQQQYYDNLRLLILEFTDLVQNSSQVDLPEEIVAIPDPASDPPEETVQIPVLELLDLIGIYQDHLIELVALEGNIEINTAVFREVTVDINQVTSDILRGGDAGFTRARNQLQAVSDQSRLALIVVSALALGLGSLAAFVLARRIIGPLNQLSDTAQRLGQGDLTQSVQITGGTELVTLANSFNTMTAQLRDLVGSLEQRVSERTKDLEYRAVQLQAAAQVAQDALTIQDVRTLLTNVANLITERFNYYHTGIFLLDDKKEYAILQAASSEGGQQMLKKGHQLRVGREGIVGTTAMARRPHIALDVGKDAIFFDNPDLPQTRSEIALPLLINEDVIGILDIQSTESQAFAQQDVEILLTLANQVALAIQNARLREEAQVNIAQLEAFAAEQTRSVWREHLEKKSHGFLYTPLEIKPLASEGLSESIGKDDELSDSPIILRGRKIGNISLKRSTRKWTQKEQALASEVADQVALAVENSRLVNETREQAYRDQLITQFSSRLRETLDMDTVVKTALEEMKKTFGLDEAEVRLNISNENRIED
ncbi:MAG: GAF domain-containing protein [Anaerolineae bacterium]|nr:GAF domain-containing protein [Anaerolineae bacterium]